MMFSATWPMSVRRMANEFLRQAVEIRIGSVDALQANTDIQQEVIMCNGMQMKQAGVLSVLRAYPGQAIVFTGTKRMADQLAMQMNGQFRCDAIHGDRNQQQRDMALAKFKAGQTQVLVATDVASRGLDIKGVKVVINFDPANNAEDYVHRIGRTGRAGQKGLAVSLLTMQDGHAAQNIMQVMQKTGLAIPQALSDAVKSGQMSFDRPGKGKGKGRR